MTSTLDWMPKPFGPGDIAGDGTQKLLGTSLAAPELLVRETAQNSWDARVREGASVPEYRLQFRALDESGVRLLRESVFPQMRPGASLRAALERPSMEVIEISDRGTTGLRGPTRNDALVRPGDPTDYRDFILTVGAKQDQKNGGGTYGFGKTAAFRASRHSTVIVWSRVRLNSGEYQERFIAVAINESFQYAGKRYTGQQWWGRKVEDSKLTQAEPLLGNEAHELADRLFCRGFGDDETGTSLLVLDPRYDALDESSDGGRAAFVEAAREAVMRNLWPKTMGAQESQRAMRVMLVDGDRELDLHGMQESRVFRDKCECLRAIRSVQAGGASRNPLIRIVPITWGRGRKLVGHLALSKPVLGPSDMWEDLARTVTLMRSEAELIVEDKEYPHVHGGDAWAGVFKPVSQLDDVFAKAEPPSHDKWDFSALEGHEKSLVKVGLERVLEGVREYVRPPAADPDVEGHSSTGAIAAVLGKSLGGAIASGAEEDNPSTARKGRRGKAKAQGRGSGVEVLGWELLPDDDSVLSRTRFTLQVVDEKPVRVVPVMGIAIDGGQIRPDGGSEVFVENCEMADGTPLEADCMEVPSSTELSVTVAYPHGVAIDCTFRTVEI